MKIRSVKLKYVVTGGMLFIASWLGYWLGFVIHHTGPEKHDLSVQGHPLIDIKPVGINPKPIENPGELTTSKKDVQAKSKIEMKPDIDIGEEVLLDSVRAKMAEHEAKRQQQMAEHGRLNDQQILHKHYLEQQKTKNKGEGQPQVQPQGQIEVQDDHYALIHSGLATRVHGQIHEKLRSLPEHIDTNSYVFEANSLPAKPRQRPSIGNGHVGTVVHSADVYMNGLYNGYLQRSHRAAIPSTCTLNVTSTSPETSFKRRYRLNAGEGIYSEISKSDSYTLTQRLYAHRNLTRLLVVEIDLVRKIMLPLTLNIKLNKWTPSRDITFLSPENGMDEVSYKFGRTNAAETDDDRPHEVHVLYDHVPNQLIAPANHLRVKWVFLTAIAHTKNDAVNAYKQGATLIKTNDALYSSHVQAWADLWSRGRVDTEGNLTLAKALYGSQYYLMSSMPTFEDTRSPFVGLSPTGLPYGRLDQDYQGHVFWDQETWMYPPILFFHADLAKLLLGTRARTAKMAEKFAKSFGRKGMQFPWESAYTGWDVTRDANCSKYELHISGDISHAIAQYLYATHDLSIIQKQPIKGVSNVSSIDQSDTPLCLDILAGVATFWVSKLTFNQQIERYEIKEVMPPDEDSGVHDNSVYTNTIAQIALEATEYALSLLGKSASQWQKFAEAIYIPFDSKLQYHPEYDGYVKGTRVKQADVILLGYPLLRNMPEAVRRNDLSFYQKVTRTTGPAMSWGMYSIGWLELGEKEKGHQLFQKNFEYIHPAFQVWNEKTNGEGAANFITGVGGFLQNLISGYAGFRLHPNQLAFNPILPPGTSKMQLTDVDYLGSSFDFYYSDSEMIVTLKKKQSGSPQLLVYIFDPEQIHSLVLGQSVKMNFVAKGVIVSKETELPEE